jgi:hypothetical protein
LILLGNNIIRERYVLKYFSKKEGFLKLMTYILYGKEIILET